MRNARVFNRVEGIGVSMELFGVLLGPLTLTLAFASGLGGIAVGEALGAWFGAAVGLGGLVVTIALRIWLSRRDPHRDLPEGLQFALVARALRTRYGNTVD